MFNDWLCFLGKFPWHSKTTHAQHWFARICMHAVVKPREKFPLVSKVTCKTKFQNLWNFICKTYNLLCVQCISLFICCLPQEVNSNQSTSNGCPFPICILHTKFEHTTKPGSSSICAWYAGWETCPFAKLITDQRKTDKQTCLPTDQPTMQSTLWNSREILFSCSLHYFYWNILSKSGDLKVVSCVYCCVFCSGPDAHVRYTVQGIIVRYDGEHITTRKVITVLRDFDPRKENPDKLAIPVSSNHVLELLFLFHRICIDNNRPATTTTSNKNN